MASCDEVAHLSTHEDDFHKVFCDHSSNQRKLNIIYKQLSNEEQCLNTQNPHQNNPGILSDTLLTIIDHLYKYNKKFYMGNTLIIEKKIKISNQ